jgi:hypothetical protein
MQRRNFKNYRKIERHTMKEKILQILRKYGPEDVLIYAHADHDGICAAFGLNYLFGELETVFSKPFRPSELLHLENKKIACRV